MQTKNAKNGEDVCLCFMIHFQTQKKCCVWLVVVLHINQFIPKILLLFWTNDIDSISCTPPKTNGRNLKITHMKRNII